LAKRQSVDLEQQRADDPLDLARLVDITSFLADHVELIEEKNAALGTNLLKKARKSDGSLAKVAGDYGLIPNDQQWPGELASECFGQGRLPVARRPGEENSVTWFQVVCPQKVRTVLLFDHLSARSSNGFRKDQMLEATSRLDIVVELPEAVALQSHGRLRAGRAVGLQMAGQTVGQHVVLFGSLLRDQGLERLPEEHLVTLGACPNKVE